MEPTTDSAEPAVTLDRGLPRTALRRVTVVLCATEIVSWGILYYAFPVLAPSISDDTGWSSPAVVAAFTVAQLVAAGIGLLVGRRIHHRGPHGVMTLGSVVAVAAVLLVAQAGSWWWFVAAWCVAGAAMAATLYQPAFAALTIWAGPRRLQALTALTLVAGLASTVFAPLTAVLDERLGWRDAYTVLAGLLVITVVLHAWGLRAPWPTTTDVAAGPSVDGSAADHPGSSPWRMPGFARTATAFTLAATCMWSVIIVFVPLLTARGFSTEAAATALGIGGIGQVCGRLGYRRLDAATSTATRTRLVFAGVAVTTLALAVTPGPYAALVMLSFLAGMARGIYTLLQATAVTDRWGTTDYARLNATLALPLTASAAFAPWLATALAAGLGSHAATLVVLALLAAASLAVVPTRIDAVGPVI
ncbi:MFS transporter [Nocardioides soli]|uniref:MFS family permease n=1 Tax=Nocardioides soli TaxID=1036020 RepID=A0A7W4W020_9ACTN|nr:MFS family permease [Nocardioides soli]